MKRCVQWVCIAVFTRAHDGRCLNEERCAGGLLVVWEGGKSSRGSQGERQVVASSPSLVIHPPHPVVH